MDSMHGQMSQKDYLKKYLSKDKGEKKKKKKNKVSSSTHLKRSVIIDDDLGLPNVASVDDEEFNLDYLGDEAPQIAGVVDERPLEVRAKESHASNKWKPLGETEEKGLISDLVERLGQLKDASDLADLNGKSGETSGKKEVQDNKRNKKPRRRDSDSDLSPPRSKYKRDKKESYGDSEKSPPRGRKRGNDKHDGSDSDLTPPRNKSRNDPKSSKTVSKRRDDSGSDSDLSLPRNKKKDYYKNNKSASHRKTNESDSDLSPPRGRSRNVHRKQRESDSDLSPPHHRNKDTSRPNKISSKRRTYSNSDSDMSPPRRSDKVKNKSHDSRPPLMKNKRDPREESNSDSDLSPPRKSKPESSVSRSQQHSERGNKHFNRDRDDYRGGDSNKSKNSHSHRFDSNQKYNKARGRSPDSDHSPPRRHRTEKAEHYNGSKKKQEFRDRSNSPMREKRRNKSSDSDLSPPRREKNRKMDKTLDGKKAGLQEAKNLKEELIKLKQAEDVAFSKLQASVSGKNASTIIRDRKTGKIRDLEKEKEEKIIKSAKTIEREKKYERWGKGLKQIEDAEERLADALHEMSKPLARYAGDDDLEKMLKEREREGDPMLDYIKSKQAESISIDITGKPKYQGHFMPNRFGIRPGHRWDGVDRSNGYEKQWFEKQNARKAIQEEAYKWSTSDM